MVSELLSSYYNAQGRPFPWRKKGLHAWPVLIAEVMLHMTIAIKVGPVWSVVLHRYRTPASIARAKENELHHILEPLGLQNQRTSQLKRLGTSLVRKHGGQVPFDEGSLNGLPGVGKYTARAFLWTVGKRAGAPVDRNVLRVYRRLTGEPRLQEDKIEAIFGDTLESSNDGRATFLGLLDLSARFCRPNRPKCQNCLLCSFCATGKRKVRLGKGGLSNA
jgi:A/G-specific adenine glycosylase